VDSDGNAAMKVLEDLAQGRKPSDWQLAAAIESCRRVRVRCVKLREALAETLAKYAGRNVPKRITRLVESPEGASAA